MTERKHDKYERLIARAQALAPAPCAVAHPCDESSLRGAVQAGQMGLLKPILIGSKARIEALAAQFCIDISACEVVDAPHSEAAAETAVRLAREGKAEILMKGSLHTDELMAAVVKRDTGLRTSRRISHCFIIDVPAIDRVVIITDAAVNIFPTLEDKIRIVQNAIDLARALGLQQPKVAILSAMECALSKGRSVATTMGFTAVDGLPMGTRCGAVDPGVILYLTDQRGMDVRAIEKLIYQQSGLLGVSGVSSDMRELLASEVRRASLAVDLYVYRIGRELGSLAAALGGLGALVFTGGIGENSAEIRARVCRDAAWLGVTLDEPANHTGGPRISAAASKTAAWVVPTNEELMIARHTRRVLG